MKISVVTPIYKSAPYLEELCNRSVLAIASIGADDYEIILVNDGSPDDGLAVAKRLADNDPKVVAIDLSRNFGQHRAILTGLTYATGDFVFVMDSDLEEDPEWIALFYHELCRTGCDAVFGVDQQVRRSPLTIWGGGSSTLSSLPYPASTFQNVVAATLMTRRWWTRSAVRGARGLSQWNLAYGRICTMRGQRHEVSKKTETYSFPRVAGLFINGVTAFLTRPLIAISIIGICVSAIAFAFSGWVIFRKVAYGVAVPGWASVMAATLVIGGITLFFNGVMAVYIAKIFLEVKRRPLSIVREVYNKADDRNAPARQDAQSKACGRSNLLDLIGFV